MEVNFIGSSNRTTTWSHQENLLGALWHKFIYSYLSPSSCSQENAGSRRFTSLPQVSKLFNARAKAGTQISKFSHIELFSVIVEKCIAWPDREAEIKLNKLK